DFSMVLGSASAICAMGLARLGTPVAFLGKAGDDPGGRVWLDARAGGGVDVSRAARDGAIKTGVTVAITRPAADRALVSYLGSIGALVRDDVRREGPRGFAHPHGSSFDPQQGLRAAM